MINMELYDPILFILHYMFLSEDAYHFICKKYSYTRYMYRLMNRLPSLKKRFGYH